MSQTLTREPIWAALFSLLQTIQYPPDPTMPGTLAPLLGYSRRLKHWADVDASLMPCLFLAEGDEDHSTPKPGMQDVILMMGKVYIYLNCPDSVIPGQVRNPVMDQLQALFPSALATTIQLGKQTLGGLVQHAIIKGQVATSEGTLGNIEVVVVPIEMLVLS